MWLYHLEWGFISVDCLTFILQKLASIFSCSTSFLAWPTLMVLFTGVSPFILTTNKAIFQKFFKYKAYILFNKHWNTRIKQTNKIIIIKKLPLPKLFIPVYTAGAISSQISSNTYVCNISMCHKWLKPCSKIILILAPLPAKQASIN